MDHRLMSWGRAVKQRTGTGLPVLWLFTDAKRLGDPLPSISRLPRGLCGVVFRHDGVPGRVELAMRVAKLCRRRGLALVVAGDTRIAWKAKAGIHLRGGRRQGFVRPPRGLITSSVHNAVEHCRARRAGADIHFISVAFATKSHPGDSPLGAVRWVALARRERHQNAYALGGITGQTIKRLAGHCGGAGAIHALSDHI